MKPILVWLICCSLLLSQAQLPVGAEVPAGSVLTLSEDKVVFDLVTQGYPPPAFPAFYTLSEPIVISFFSNVDGNWTIEAGISGGLLSQNGALIPAAQLEYRLDGAGEWRPLGQRVVLLTRLSASAAYEKSLLELRLKLIGNERPGRYQGVLEFSLTGL